MQNFNALAESKIWMSSPIHFNDPFNSKIYMSCEKDQKIGEFE